MKLQCCFCKHIVCNSEYDGMLDCELALEEEGKPRCSNKFEKFELKTDEKICTRYLNYWQQDFKAFNSVQKHHGVDFERIKQLIVN